jgi:hypothetical protein
MILAIACLVIGIVALVKGKMAVTGKKEIRGGPLYAAAILLILPLPLSFMAGFLLGATAGPEGISENTVMVAGVITTWAPILAAIIIGFIFAQPKTEVAPPGAAGPRGFEPTMKQ